MRLNEFGPNTQDMYLHYASDIGDSFEVPLPDGSSHALATKLEPGRYMLVLKNGASSIDRVWVKVGKFVNGVPIVAVADVGAKTICLSKESRSWFEFNVVEGLNDGIAAISELANDATTILFIFRVSR